MPDYSKGKIYKIITSESDEIYIGSTAQHYLSERIGAHRTSYRRFLKNKTNYCSCFGLFEKYGVNTCEIKLIENYPCSSKSELEAKEQEWIDKLDCINRQKASTGIDISKTENPKEYMKEYYKINKEKISQYKKDYAIINKEKIKEKAKEKTICECGGIFRKRDTSQHLKTKKHLDYIEKQ